MGGDGSQVESQLSVRVLGNPVEGKTVEIEISGADGQLVDLTLIDLQGRVLHHDSLPPTGASDRVIVPIGSDNSFLLLQVSTPTQRQQVKLLKR